MSFPLSPAQKTAFDQLIKGIQVGSIFWLSAGTGRGKTTLLRELHKQTGGAFLNTNDFFAASVKTHPLALEETVYQLIFEKLQEHSIVYMDDVDLLDIYSAGCHFYPRGGLFNSVLMGVCTHVIASGKKIVFGTHGRLADSASQRSYRFGIERFAALDYSALSAVFCESSVDAIDFKKVFRFAPKLNAHQLKAACRWLEHSKALNTDSFIEYLKSQRLVSNIDLGEVQAVDLKDLKGVDNVLRSLEINIILPLENDELATQFKLRAKRGVLLYGPPGTGKTTVGRALAHRLKSKFFLIDGTFIAGSRNFYERVSQIFEAAKENAPSIIFIDDADAIFEDGGERGLYRYLLTMLDGLESESAGRICVMMTAMNVAHLPPALVRSGRIELWLEMKLPDACARRSILADYIAALPEELRNLDVDKLVAATEGFTGADLKCLVEDGKGIYAFDKSRNEKMVPTTDYFLHAIESVRQNKRHYAAAEAMASNRAKSDVPDYAPEMGDEEDE